ncbi:MAG: MATE family efflux transporter [Oscillospiraceae bacterium]|nr:MATE family efflux transporter [Oscillospiraceae bacterium]
MDKEDKRIYTLKEEKPFKAVVRMGVPLILGMFVMVFYNLVDTYFIGLLKDDYQLAAVNLAYPVMMMTVALSNIVGTGASSHIARCIGAKEVHTAEETLTAAFVMCIIGGAAVTLTGLLFLDGIVRGLGAMDNTFVYTRKYVLVILIGTVFTMGNYISGALLRGEGSVKYSMLGMVVGTVVNIILDPLFIFTFRMEIAGAAIATVLGNVCGAAVSVMLYACGKTLLVPRKAYIRPRIAIVSEIFRVGIPAALETLLTSAAYIVNNNLAVAYGELTVAAMGVAQKILSFGNYIYQGFASGTQPLMGYNYGAKNYRRMRDILKAGMITVSCTELAVMAVYGAFAPFLIGIFTQTEEVILIGTKVLRTVMFILPFVGITSMSRMSFQAMGKPSKAFIITVIRQGALYIPLLLLLNRLFGFDGMIRAQPITEFIMMIVSSLLLFGLIADEEKKCTNKQ